MKLKNIPSNENNYSGEADDGEENYEELAKDLGVTM